MLVLLVLINYECFNTAFPRVWRYHVLGVVYDQNKVECQED